MTNAIRRAIFRNDADDRMDGESESDLRRCFCGGRSGFPRRPRAWRGDLPGCGEEFPCPGRGRVLMPGWARLTIAVSGCWLQACIPWRQPASPERELAEVAAELARVVAPAQGSGEVALLGLRDGKGRRTAATRLVDRYLRAALEQTGAVVAAADEEQPAPWGAAEAVPAGQWENLAAPRVVAGRLQAGRFWTYLRLFAIDRESGRVVASATRRLERRLLRAEVARGGRQGEVPAGGEELQVDLHLLGLRSDGGWARSAAVEEGGMLQPGDRLQIRFKTGADCEVYAFLYNSQAEVEEVFAPRFVYAGRMHYGPGEETWVSLHRADRTYTLYFIAAERLGEDREELFEAMAALVEQGRAGGREGMERLDRLLVEFLRREVEGDEEVAVVRGRDGIERGEKVDFILADGTPLESRPEKLKAASVLVRAFTFAVP